MKGKSLFQKSILFILFFSFFLSVLQPLQTVYGATLKYYNYNTNSNVNYSGKQVKYFYNNRELELPYPGIIMDGIALADFEDLFLTELGLTGYITDDKITITDGNTVLVMTIGSKSATVNGVKKTLSIAPVKLKFSDSSVKLYVPTRFVAETFGYSYVWVSSSSTVRITKTLHLNVGSEDVTYNGTFYAVSYGEQKINLDTMPMLYYNGSVLARAEAVFEAAGCSYEESGDKLLITKGNITLTAEAGSKTAYVNGVKFVMELSPVRITDTDSGRTYMYIPLEFVSEMLGFGLSYSDAKKMYSLSETEYTGKIEQIPVIKNHILSDAALNKVEKNEPLKYYFEWNQEESFSIPEVSVYQYLTKVKAYGVEGADILELYGISSENINAFIDHNLLIFELDETIACMNNQYFSDYSNPYLRYSLLSGLSNSTVLYFMMQPEDTWHFVDRDGYVQIYFTAADLDFEELFTSSVSETATPKYFDDRLVIPLPAECTITDISDYDNYLQNNFQIMLSGDYTEFYKTNKVYNPYYMVKNHTVAYDSASNMTIITFYTNSVCAYQYTKETDYLAVTVGKPGELYSKVIVLDAGHGGTDPGAIKNGIKEKDLNFKILNTYVKEAFANSDIKVYFTRNTDVLIDLYDRAAFSSEIGADLFISLHMNTNNSSSPKGTEVFYSSANNKSTASGLNSYKLAKALASNISTALGTKNRGATNSEFVVAKYNTVPAVLIELGFMTNTSDFAKLKDTSYQKKAANAIYQTVVQIFEDYPAN